MENNKSILLIGANFRAMFFVAQKLHQLGYIIDVVDFEEIPLGSSKYIRHYECVQNKNYVSALKEAVFALLNNSYYEAIIPINDLGLMLCKECFTELSTRNTQQLRHPEGQTHFGNEAPPKAQRVISCTEGCVLWSRHLRRREGAVGRDGRGLRS